MFTSIFDLPRKLLRFALGVFGAVLGILMVLTAFLSAKLMTKKEKEARIKSAIKRQSK